LNAALAYAAIVPASVMPKGVEHNVWRRIELLRLWVPASVMPKGVEHTPAGVVNLVDPECRLQ